MTYKLNVFIIVTAEYDGVLIFFVIGLFLLFSLEFFYKMLPVSLEKKSHLFSLFSDQGRTIFEEMLHPIHNQYSSNKIADD